MKHRFGWLILYFTMYSINKKSSYLCYYAEFQLEAFNARSGVED